VERREQDLWMNRQQIGIQRRMIGTLGMVEILQREVVPGAPAETTMVEMTTGETL
jgi:hypothetical protein